MSDPATRDEGRAVRRPRRRVPEEARRDDDAVDVASEDSFPASDPPALTPGTIGAPVRKRADVAPSAEPGVPATEEEARDEQERDPERAGTAGREGRSKP